MSGGPTSARSERPEPSQVDVEERGQRTLTPEHDHAGEATWTPSPVLRGRRARRDRTGTLVALTLVAIAVAAVKPWGLGAPLPSVPPPTVDTGLVLPPPSSAPQPTPGPVIADRNAMTCLTHQVEQVLTLERWPDREIKSWSQPESGVVTISSSHVVGIGVCPGIGPVLSSSGASEPPRDPEAWGGAVLTDVRLLDGGDDQDLGRPPRITQQADYVAAGVLYGPPVPVVTRHEGVQTSSPGPQSSAGPAWRQVLTASLQPWPAGRYAISYFFPGDPETVVRTVIVQIVAPLHDG